MPVARRASLSKAVNSGGGYSYGVPAPWQRAYLGPGAPIQPITPPRDVEIPRSIDFPIAVNAQLTPRSGYGIMPFSAIKLAYEKVPECRAPVRLIERQLSAFTPHLVDKKQNIVLDHPMQWMCDKPDGETPFSVWASRYLKSGKVYDAPALYFERDNSGGICGLHYIDGSTLFVIVDAWGRTPKPMPVQDYVQSDYASLAARQEKPPVSLAASGPSSVRGFIDSYERRWRDGKSVPDRVPAYTQVIKGTPFAWWSSDDIWYMPESKRTDSPYGEPFIEAAWPWIMIIVSLTNFELGHYKTGNMPEGFITLPRDWGVTPDQLEALETAFNRRMTSNPATERNRVRIFPDGSKWFQTKRAEWEEKLYDRARHTILDTIGVQPSEFGDIPGETLGGKGMAHAQQSGLNRNTLNPNRNYLSAPFNETLKQNGVTDVSFSLTYPTQELDPEKLKEALTDGLMHGEYSLNEVRGQLSLPPIGDTADESQIANKHWFVAGAAIYVVEDMKDPGGLAQPTFAAPGGGAAGGLPVGPEGAVKDQHTPEDKKTLDKAISNLLATGTLDGKFYSIPKALEKAQTVKRSQSEVSYTDHAEYLSRRCAVCQHYGPSRRCEVVAGEVNPDGWCTIFESEPSKLVKWNPDQPRDEHGRFAPMGGVGAGVNREKEKADNFAEEQRIREVGRRLASKYDLWPNNVEPYENKANRLLGVEAGGLESFVQGIGAPEGSSLQLEKNGNNGLSIVSSNDDIYMHRTLSRSQDGLVIHNEALELSEDVRGSGLGTKILSQEVDWAGKNGVVKIYTTAGKSSSMNGYYTWPRLGYDGDLEEYHIAKAEKAGFGQVSRVSDLMKTERGRNWWKKNGSEIDLEFDPRPGSYSTRVLEAYKREKGL